MFTRGPLATRPRRPFGPFGRGLTYSPLGKMESHPRQSGNMSDPVRKVVPRVPPTGSVPVRDVLPRVPPTGSVPVRDVLVRPLGNYPSETSVNKTDHYVESILFATS